MKSRLFLFAVCASAACFLQAAPLDVSGFSKSLTITVPAASVAQGVLLTEFPALVRLSTAINGFSYSDFQQQDGADLAFLDSRGNVLAHEIDTWNEQGESLVWVKVPAFSRSTRIYVVYGNAGYSSSVSPTNTWSDFTGVWHMKEASGTVADATGHGLTATPSGSRAEYNIGISGGVVGMARQNGGNGSFGDKAYLSIPNYDSYNLFIRRLGTGDSLREGQSSLRLRRAGQQAIRRSRHENRRQLDASCVRLFWVKLQGLCGRAAGEHARNHARKRQRRTALHRLHFGRWRLEFVRRLRRSPPLCWRAFGRPYRSRL